MPNRAASGFSVQTRAAGRLIESVSTPSVQLKYNRPFRLCQGFLALREA